MRGSIHIVRKKRNQECKEQRHSLGRKADKGQENEMRDLGKFTLSLCSRQRLQGCTMRGGL